MSQPARDWKRLTETYNLTEQKRLATHEGQKSLTDRFVGLRVVLSSQLLPHYFGKAPKWRLWLRSKGAERTLPDFACVGAIKSGTSDLSAYLFQHPCILPPLSKEILNSNVGEWRPYYPTVREKARVEKEHGKALSGYFLPVLNSLRHIDSLRESLPDARIVLMLRNPIDRAYSHYKSDLLLSGGRLAQTPYYKSFAGYVDIALDLFPSVFIPTRSGQILQTGIYAKSVELWIDRFGRERVHILRAEDFFQDIATAVCGIHEFLGIPSMKPDIHPIVNQSPIKLPPMEEEVRLKLRAFYEPWNEKLYSIIGRDMNWD
jgi:hypothetical protein